MSEKSQKAASPQMATPPGRKAQPQRPQFWMVIRACIQIAAFIDAVYLVLFWVIGSPLLAWVNVLSLCMYAAAYVCLTRRKNKLAVLLIWAEVLGHASLGTHLIGWDSGFHYFLLMFIPAVFVSTSRYKAMLVAVLLWCFYIGMNIAAEAAGPAAPLPQMYLDLVRYVNISMVFAMFAHLCSYYVANIRKTQQRLHKAFEQLSRFSSDVAHELRTPLTALSNQGEVALRNAPAGLDASTQKFMELMLEESFRLGRMIDRLLLIAQADQRRIKAAVSLQRVGDVAQDAINIMNVLAEDRGVSLRMHGSTAITAILDADFLRQTLIDVLDNALKYAGKNIAIRISADAHHARIDVADDGPGIPPDDRVRMLQRFARGDNARTRLEGQADGFGLGLSIALSLTELQGGTLTLYDAACEGFFRSGLVVTLRFGKSEQEHARQVARLEHKFSAI